jgi:hypothetical protein
VAAAGRGGAHRALTVAPGARAASGGPSAEPAPRPALGLAALLLALGALSALKGLNTFVDPTASYFYYADYRFGFVARGLVGQLFAPALDALPAGAHRGLLVAWHFAGLAALLAALARLAARTVAAAAGRADVLAAAILLFCSPLVPSLAYFTAAPDPLLCLLTLAVVAAARAGRHALACVVLLVGTLAHQLMVFLALPLLVLASLVHARRPAPAVAVALAAGLAACLIVLAAPAPDARLVGRLVAHGVPLEDARGLVQLQLGQGAFEMLGVMAGMWRANPLNGAIALAHGAAGGVAILAVCLLTPGALRPVAERLPPAVPAGPRGLLAGLLVDGCRAGSASGPGVRLGSDAARGLERVHGVPDGGPAAPPGGAERGAAGSGAVVQARHARLRYPRGGLPLPTVRGLVVRWPLPERLRPGRPRSAARPRADPLRLRALLRLLQPRRALAAADSSRLGLRRI